MSTKATTSLFFLQCAPGLEGLLAREVGAWGIRGSEREGGIEVRGTREVLQRVCLRSRLADSVRLRFKEFPAHDFSQLSEGVRRLPLRAYLAEGTKVRLRAVCHKSRLFHSGAVEERVAQVLSGFAGLRVVFDEDAPYVHVRLSEDRVQISLEAASLLHRRGYREKVDRASLRETLAAALLLSSSEQAGASAAPALWDPFCGAGTIALEALHIAEGRFSGEKQVPAFFSWRDHDAALYSEWLEEERKVVFPGWFSAGLRVFGSDRSEASVALARENEKAGEFVGAAQLLSGDIEAIANQVPEGAFVVTNPPYGKRLEEARSIQKLFRVIKARQDLKPVIALVGGAARDAVPKDRPALFRTKNGGLPVSARLLRG